jgi:aminopeptidase
MDARYHKLAEVLTHFSTAVKPGENVLIEGFDIPEAMLVALIRAVRARKAFPHVQIHSARVTRELYRDVQEGQFDVPAKIDLARIKQMDAYIAVRGTNNIFELSDVPPEKLALGMKKMKAAMDWRVKKTRWVVLRWPSASMAQQARMSTEAFEDFFFKVCTLDYSRMQPGMEALRKLMLETDKVHIVGKGTDLRFSIKGIGAVTCGGSHNIPDGEVFTCPVKNSVEGVITYNVPTVYRGTQFENIRLRFHQGKIVEAECNETGKLNQILDSDPGARYIGEFAIGFNPHILEPMQDILFDEKIAGSFHFTPGQAYEEADNGNRSQVHWDLVNIQRPEYGGGEIYFDGKLIRKDGLFVPKALQKLNPDYLLA